MSETERVRKQYDWYSRFYDKPEGLVELLLFSKWRKKYLSDLKGEILEVGVGTGKNLQYYNTKAQVTGIDFSPGMLEKAKTMYETLGSPDNIELKLMDAQHLDFLDNHFDYVIATFVLCSIPDPVKGLKEIKRVLKPYGKFIAVEHMLSRNFFIALHEHIMNPITKNLFGFNINRKTAENIKKSGLKIVEEKNLGFFDVFRKIISQK